MFTASQIVVWYFIKLEAMFTVWKIPPTPHSNGKQNTQLQNKIEWQ